MTSVVDTRLLLALQFPSDKSTGDKIRIFVRKEMTRGVVLPSIVLSEFVKIAGSRIGIQAALNTITMLKEHGMKVQAIDEELALEAGKLLLEYGPVPLADSLIAAFASSKIAEYVLSDDPYFKDLGIKTRWFS
jgi:predicted nucleic acid-binding protein